MFMKISIITGIVGALFIIIGLSTLFGFLPKIVQSKVNDELILTNTSEIYNQSFVSLPVPLKFKIWAFECDLSTFDHKYINTITWKKRGPYVYDEYRVKKCIQFSNDGKNVSFVQDKSYKFNKNESCKDCNENDKITFFNPLMAMEQEALDLFRMTSKNQPETFKYFDLLTYDYDTINDILMTGNSQLGIPIINSPDVNDNVMDTGKSDIKQLEQLIYYGESENLTIWNNNDDGSTSRCNTLKGTDGTQFQPGLNGDETLWVYEPMLCFSLKSKYGILSDEDVKDISTYRYTIQIENFIDSVENKCFCLENNVTHCPSGVLNLKKCGASKGFEFLASPAYFYDAPEHLKWTGLDKIVNIDDINKENCATYFDIEPTTGIVLNAVKKLMLSIKVRKNAIPKLKDLAQLTEFYDHQIAPFLYIEEMGGIDDMNANKLKDKLMPRKIARIILILLIVVGVLLICASVFFYFR